MTRYEFYKKVASILTKNNADALFEYIIHSMDDDGGFLRTRYCYWEETLPNRSCKNITIVLVALKEPFDFENFTEYYEKEDEKCGLRTKLEMQLFWYESFQEDCFMSDVEWCAELDYTYPIKIDLVNDSFARI